MKYSAVLVMPRGVAAWPTAEALWVTASGWAGAAERRFGSAWIATPGGAWSPELLPRPQASARRARRSLQIPAVLRTLAKDVALWTWQSRFEVPVSGPWSESRVQLVWEHHDLFNEAGGRLSEAARAPLVRYVHAPQVWEAWKWGVRRPLWGRLITALELRHLQEADVVACVSHQVREQLQRMGVDPARIVVAPMGVDTDRFSPTGSTKRPELGLDAATVVVGWCGSFRPFHGLELLIDAFRIAARTHPELHLLLIGDGPMRASLETTARRGDVAGRVTFTGAVSHAEMPEYLRAVDIAVVSSEARGSFHYSPLKLREYAACELPVVAPTEGELAEFGPKGFLSLHEPGSLEGLSETLSRLAGDGALRGRLGRAARDYCLEHWSWDRQLETTLERARALGHVDAAGRSRTSPSV